MNSKILFLLVFLTGLPARALSQTEPPVSESVAKLISQLGAADFRTREQATKELEKVGNSALPALRKAAKGKLELEVKRRIEQLITRIETAPFKAEEKHWQDWTLPGEASKRSCARFWPSNLH
jgi:hypothetical protein